MEVTKFANIATSLMKDTYQQRLIFLRFKEETNMITLIMLLFMAICGLFWIIRKSGPAIFVVGDVIVFVLVLVGIIKIIGVI